VEPDARHQLPPLLRRDATVDDGYLYGLSRPVVGDRYGLSHSCPPTSECTGNARDSYPLGRSGRSPSREPGSLGSVARTTVDTPHPSHTSTTRGLASSSYLNLSR